MLNNVYEAPEADLEVDGEKKRPKFVWFVFLYTCFGLISTIGSQVAIARGLLPVEGATKEYFESMGVLDYSLIFLSTLYSFYAALTLFRLKILAIKLYWGYIPIISIGFLNSFSHPAYREMVSAQPATLYGMGAGFLWIAFLIFYVHRLNKKGYLKS